MLRNSGQIGWVKGLALIAFIIASFRFPDTVLERIRGRGNRVVVNNTHSAWSDVTSISQSDVLESTLFRVYINVRS